MAEKTTTKSKECKHCKSVIDFGMVCEDCVAEHRVCQMCNTSIVELDDSAMVCSPKHRTSKSRAKAALRDVTDTPRMASVDLFRAIGQTVETAIQEHPTVRIDNDSATMIGNAVVNGLAPLLEEFMHHLLAPRETVTVTKSVSVPVMPNTPLVLPDKPMNTTHTFAIEDFGDLTEGLVVKKSTVEPDKPKVDKYTANFLGLVSAFNDPNAGFFDPNAKIKSRR